MDVYPPNPQMSNLQAQLTQLQNLYSQLNPAAAAKPQQANTAPPISWVDNGLEGAKAVPMQPNTTAALFDRNDAVFYLRVTDANGAEAPIKIGRFTLEDL